MKTTKNGVEDAPMLVPRIKESPSSVPKTPSESRKLIQKQLVLLLHSHACLKKDLVVPNRPACNVPNCSMMRDVWLHIKECRNGPECSHIHCSSSLKILAHWKHCKDEECCVCQMVRLKGAKQFELHTKQYEQQRYQEMRDVGGGGIVGPMKLENQNTQHEFATNSFAGQSTTLPYQGLLMSQCQGQPQPGNEGLDLSRLNYSDNSHTTCCNPNHHHHGSHSSHPYLPTGLWPHPHAEKGSKGPNTGTMQLGEAFSPNSSSQQQNYVSHIHLNGGQYTPLIDEQHNYSSPNDVQQPFARYYYCGQIHCQQGMPNERERKELRVITQRGEMPNDMERRFLVTATNESDPTDSSLLVPSSTDVRRAYEQLGIPCPVDALRRLMATLPGGVGEVTEESPFPVDDKAKLVAQGIFRSRQRESVDTDDGIHDTMNVYGDEPEENPSWCCSHVHRLILNKEIAASTSS